MIVCWFKRMWKFMQNSLMTFPRISLFVSRLWCLHIVVNEVHHRANERTSALIVAVQSCKWLSFDLKIVSSSRTFPLNTLTLKWSAFCFCFPFLSSDQSFMPFVIIYNLRFFLLRSLRLPLTPALLREPRAGERWA